MAKKKDDVHAVAKAFTARYTKAASKCQAKMQRQADSLWLSHTKLVARHLKKNK